MDFTPLRNLSITKELTLLSSARKKTVGGYTRREANHITDKKFRSPHTAAREEEISPITLLNLLTHTTTREKNVGSVKSSQTDHAPKLNNKNRIPRFYTSGNPGFSI